MPMFKSYTTDGKILDVETAVKDGILGGGCGIVSSFSKERLDLSTMIRELELVEVPIVFVCPISLETMQDPVTLCTGQTYERSNILKWFSVGRLTCPITMQELWDDSITPNKTLLQLIYAWFSQKLLAMRKKSEDVEGRAVELLALLRSKGQVRILALKELKHVITSHVNIKRIILDNDGVDLLVFLLGPFTSYAVGSEVIGILANLYLDSDSISNLLQPAKMSLVINIMNEGCISTKINCIRLIEFLIEGKNRKNLSAEIVFSLSLVVGLMRLAKDKRHPKVVFASLGLLKLVCSSQMVRNSVINIGAVPQLIELLPSLNIECLELALVVLELLADVPEGRLALKNCASTIPNLVRLLMRVSERCSQIILSILLEVLTLAPGECASIAVEAGLATKLLLVIQSACSPLLKRQSAELLKLCSLNYSASLFISKCKLTKTLQ